MSFIRHPSNLHLKRSCESRQVFSIKNWNHNLEFAFHCNVQIACQSKEQLIELFCTTSHVCILFTSFVTGCFVLKCYKFMLYTCGLKLENNLRNKWGFYRALWIILEEITSIYTESFCH